MAINFLIALATAFGSATLLLLILWLFLKIFKPNAFKDRISISEKIDRVIAGLPILTDEQMRQMSTHTFTLPDMSGWQIASLLNTGAQGARDFTVIELKIPLVAKEKEDKTPTREEILSPSGQATRNFGAAVSKKSFGVPNETLCGFAR